MQKMLTQICQDLKNWFLGEIPVIREGTFVITGGKLQADFLQPEQYFRIENSVFNDGVHKDGDILKDEVFDGRVSAMKIPPEIVDLSEEIAAWREGAGAAAVASPYQSESWGGYSYSRGGADNSAGTGGFGLTWQATFASRLNRWRKT